KLIDKDAWEESGELDLIWGSNFPEAGSLKAGEVFDTTVYGVVEGTLSTDANTYVTCEGDHVEVLSGETTEWGDYGQVYQMNVRFSGNGPATFTVQNDKCDSCQYTVDVDWWEPWASAFNLAGDPAYELYAQEYPELPEMIEKSGAATPGSPVVPVDNQWLHVKPDTGGEFVTVSIDEDAPAESFTVWVVDYEEYLETGRLPEDGAVTLLRGGSVDIPVKPDSTVLVTAEAVEKGTDSELAYTITRNDGTVETYNAGDVREHNSIVLSVKGELPEFKAQSLILTGQIGVNFYMNLPELRGVDYEESYVEFTVSGEKTKVAFDKNAKNRDGKYYRFTCFVNSVQMADRIKAVYHYARYGEEREVEATYSVRQYVEDFEAQGGFGEKATALVHALADYGHHAQPFLSALRNWTIGMDHKEMDLYYIGSYSDDALANAREDLKSRSFTVKRASDIAGAAYSLHLDSGTGINLYFTPVKGYKGGVSATVDGKTCAVEKLSDGRYRVKISDIAAHKLGKTYKVVLKTKAGKTTGEVSVLSYINDALKSAQDEDKKNAMLALYRYYVAAEAYLK
ncbi:MAG: hypothetical protein ACSW8H_08795, partial [bacterium]